MRPPPVARLLYRMRCLSSSLGSDRVDTPLSCNSSRRDCSSDNYSAGDSSIDCNSNISFNLFDC